MADTQRSERNQAAHDRWNKDHDRQFEDQHQTGGQR
jgi:hypothetical protein